MATPPRAANDTEVMGLSCGLFEVDVDTNVHTKQRSKTNVTKYVHQYSRHNTNFNAVMMYI